MRRRRALDATSRPVDDLRRELEQLDASIRQARAREEWAPSWIGCRIWRSRAADDASQRCTPWRTES